MEYPRSNAKLILHTALGLDFKKADGSTMVSYKPELLCKKSSKTRIARLTTWSGCRKGAEVHVVEGAGNQLIPSSSREAIPVTLANLADIMEKETSPTILCLNFSVLEFCDKIMIIHWF